MKRTLIIIAFIVSSLALSAQISFNKLDNYGHLSINGLNVKQIGNNNYIQYIFVDSLNRQGIGIIKSDSFGNYIKRIEFVDTAFLYGSWPFRNFISTSDSSLIMGANKYYYQSLKKEEIEIWKFDKDLNIIWNHLIDHPDTTEASQPNAEKLVRVQDLIEAKDGNYILSIKYNRKCLDASNSQNNRSLLMKLDTAGNYIWANRNNEMFQTLIEIVTTSDSGFYSPAEYPYKLNKFDKNGDFKWSVVANNIPTQTYYISACEYGDSSAIMATYYKLNSNMGEMGISVSRINANTKSVVWNKCFIIAENMLSQANLNYVPMKVFCDKWGGIYLATAGLHTNNQGYQNYYGIVLKLNSNGDSLWTNYYTYNAINPFITEIQGFMIEDDGSFVGVGYGLDQSYPQQKLWFFKTNTTGYLGVKKMPYVNSISVYPNPVTDVVNIDFSNINHSNVELQLYDISGRMVISKIITSSDNTKMDLSKLSSGIYILKIVIEGVKSKSVKIIKN